MSGKEHSADNTTTQTFTYLEVRTIEYSASNAGCELFQEETAAGDTNSSDLDQIYHQSCDVFIVTACGPQ